MSHPNRAENTYGGLYDHSDRSIGVIPGLIRSTFFSGLKMCAAIGDGLTTEDTAEQSSMDSLEEDVAEAEVVKTSVYRRAEDFGPSKMPGTWTQSMESLTAALDAVDMCASGEEEAKIVGVAVDGVFDDSDGDQASEASDASDGSDPVELTAKNFATLFDLIFKPVSDGLERTPLKFHLFPKLPTEMRLKIWRLAANHQRVIALGFVENPETARHAKLEIHARSRIPPLLQVNRESRGECRKFYVKRRSCYLPAHLFNPQADILYFGGKTHCVRAFSNAFGHMDDDLNQYNIPRVAIDLSVPLADCCDNQSISRVYDTMRSLHGYTARAEKEEPGKRYFFCRGLKEVLLVLESKPLKMVSERINPAISFRPTSSIGITEAQADLWQEFEDEIVKIQDEKPSLYGPNLWTGDDKPTFRFVNLARDRAGEAFDTVTVSGYEANELKVHYSSFINDLRRSTSCKITLPHQVYDDESPLEIGVKGTKEGVRECCRKIQVLICLQIETRVRSQSP